jgi:hypothetical protein
MFSVKSYSHEFAVAFFQATRPLCPDVQRIIWEQALSDTPEAPSTPVKKCLKPSERLLRRSSNLV